MSRSWGERVAVFVGADAVQVARYPGRFSGATPARSSAPIAAAPRGAASAQNVADALRAALGSAPTRADASIVVSNHYVRFALVPDAARLRNDTERELAARHTLQFVYGDTSAQWRIAVDRAGGKGPAIAAGIDSALVDAIVSTLKAAGLRPATLKPLFASALNASRRALGNGPAWFGVVEPGRLALAYVENGAWQSLRVHRLRRGLTEELPVLLEQDRLTGLVRGAVDGNARIVIASNDAVTVELPAGSGTLQPVAVEFAGLA